MNKIVFYLLLVLMTAPLRAQDIATAFMAMPDECIPQLEKGAKKQLVDFYLSDKTAQVPHKLGGNVILKKLTSNYLQLQMSDRSEKEYKLLPLVNKSNVICLVETVKGPVADSRISFYSTDWKSVDSADLFTPVQSSWFIREDADTTLFKYQESVSHLDLDLFKYELNPGDNTLKQIYTTPQYLDKETRDNLKPFLKEEPKVFQWNQSRYE